VIVIVVGFKGADDALPRSALDIDDANVNGTEHPCGDDVVFLICGMHFVVAFDKSSGLKYAFGSVEIEATTPHSSVTFCNGPLKVVVLIVRHYVLGLIVYVDSVYVNSVHCYRIKTRQSSLFEEPRQSADGEFLHRCLFVQREFVNAPPLVASQSQVSCYAVLLLRSNRRCDRIFRQTSFSFRLRRRYRCFFGTLGFQL